MPRKASGKSEAQRMRQGRYRARLRASGTPEADQVDHAVSASVSALAELLRRQAEEARASAVERREELRLLLGMGVLADAEAEAARAELAVPLDAAVPKPEAMAPTDLLQRVLLGAVALLVGRDCDPAQARRKVHHRIGRGGDAAALESLVQRSGITLAPKRRKPSPGDVA